MPDRLLRVSDVAARLQVSHSMIYALVDSQRLQCVRIGAAVRFRVEDVDSFIVACAVPAGEVGQL